MNKSRKDPDAFAHIDDRDRAAGTLFEEPAPAAVDGENVRGVERDANGALVFRSHPGVKGARK